LLAIRFSVLPLSLGLVLVLAGCKPPPDWTHATPGADPARGLQAMVRVGCGSCHAIPGLRWPQGAVGPSLRGFGKANLIAGHLPNRPDVLSAYVRHAPDVLPGTTMPAMPLTEQESRDVAAYLYTLVEP
jgi:cytochrome c1